MWLARPADMPSVDVGALPDWGSDDDARGELSTHLALMFSHEVRARAGLFCDAGGPTAPECLCMLHCKLRCAAHAPHVPLPALLLALRRSRR